jgi:uncharacterized RDD family membrane protein YckC
MFCSKCGATLPEGAVACAMCGQPTGTVPVAGYAAAGYAAVAAPRVLYAGFWLRFVAWIIDRLILGVVTRIIIFPVFGLSTLRMILRGHTQPEDFLPLVGMLGRVFVISLVLDWLYYALMESSAWQATLGKKALGLRVTDMQGNRVSFGRASGRFFARIISDFTLLIGYIMAGFTERKQALHDILAGCLVIRQE